MTQYNDVKTGVASRVQQENTRREYFWFGKILKSRTLSNNLKIRMYITLPRPIVLCGAEMWTLRKTKELRLMIFKRKFYEKFTSQFLIVKPNNGKNYTMIYCNGFFRSRI